MQATALRPLAVRCSLLPCTSSGAPSLIKVASRSISFDFPHGLRHKSTSGPFLLSRVSDPAIKNFILLSRISDPYINLSIENFLLQHAHKSSHVLFVYVNRPCVVIGRNQNPWVEANLRQLKAGTVDAQAIDLVRRRSGGGTVFHDAGNLNYSVMVPNDTSKGEGSFKRSTHAEMVVRAIASAKEDFAPDLKLRFPIGAVRMNERHDIVTEASEHSNPQERQNGALKVSGSAFKLTRGRALHHGTLLFGSPQLHRISDLLRSPARDFIVAKGVASVRSAVANLFDITSDEDREAARKVLERTIVREFKHMYIKDQVGEGAHEAKIPDATDESTPEAEITEPDLLSHSTATSASICNGAAELRSPAWLFEQTPGFVFSTRAIPSEPAFAPPSVPHEVPQASMQVKHGVIQGTGPGPLTHLIGRKLHEVRDWRGAILGARDTDVEALAGWLEELFPPLQLGHEAAVAADGPDTVDDVSPSADQVMRKRDDGTIEVERDGERTVKDMTPLKDHPTKS